MPVTIPDAPPYVNERHCANCTRMEECWAREGGGFITPRVFEPRPGWGPARMVNHMQRCIGGLCNNFVLHQVNVNLNSMDIDKSWDK